MNEDIRIRRCYQQHKNFAILWNGPDKGEAIPVFLGWKMRELLQLVQAKVIVPWSDAQESEGANDLRASLSDLVDRWLRSKQLREAFGCERHPGVPAVREPLQKLLSKHLTGDKDRVTDFFDYVRYVCPLDEMNEDNMPKFLRHYIEGRMPNAVASLGASCACCAEKERSVGKPDKVADEILRAYSDAFEGGEPPEVAVYMDVGCGTCTTASAIARKLCLSKDHVICLDIEESCGERADDVTFRIFNGEKLPQDSASVDLVTFIHVLHHVEPGGSSMFHLLQEVGRVLKPGGVVVVKEHDSPNRDYDLYLEAMHSLKQLVFYTNEPERMPLGSYQSVADWKVTFRRVCLPVVHTMHTQDIYNSVLFVLEKIADGT